MVAFDAPRNSYFQNKLDLENLMRAVRTTIAIAHTSPLSDKLVFEYDTNNKDMNDMYWLADQDPETLTDEKLAAWVRLHAQTLYHPVRALISFHALLYTNMGDTA